MSDRPPALDPATVEAFVAKAHGDLDFVRSALGIPLRAHAAAGGEQARAVLALL